MVSIWKEQVQVFQQEIDMILNIIFFTISDIVKNIIIFKIIGISSPRFVPWNGTNRINQTSSRSIATFSTKLFETLNNRVWLSL